MKQSIDRQCSQEEAAIDEQHYKASASQPVEPRHSSADREFSEGSSESSVLEMSDTMINGQQQHGKSSSLCYDSAIGPKATGNFVSAAGKGTGGKSDGPFATRARDQSIKVAMAKKRKAPCGRSRSVQALVAGVVTFTVVSGLALCQVSPAASWISFAADKVKPLGRLLCDEMFNKVRLLSMHSNDVLQLKWLTLLKNKQLQHAARALTFMVNKKMQAQLTVVVKVTNDISHELAPAISYLMDAFQLLRQKIQPLVPFLLTLIEFKEGGDNDVLNQVQSFSVTTCSSFVKSLMCLGEWMESCLEHILAWTGLTFNAKDVILPDNRFLALLKTNEVEIERIGRELTAHELQALQDVKRFEKRRVTIAFETQTILAETRDFALESIGRIKMAALETVEYRLKQLEEQYAQSFDQALHQYERTSRELEKEGGAAMMGKTADESRAHAYTATALKRALTENENSDDGEQVEATVTEGGGQFGAESGHECSTDDRCLNGKQDLVLNELFESNKEVPTTNLGNKDVVQAVTELETERIMIGERIEVPVAKRSLSEKTFNGKHMDEEKLSATVERVLSALEGASVGGHRKDYVRLGAELLDDEVVTMELDSSDKKAVAGEVQKTSLKEVLVNLNNDMLEMKHYQVEFTELLNLYNRSDEVKEIQQEDCDTSSIDVAHGQTDCKLNVDTDEGGTDQVEVKGAHFDVRTHVTIGFRSEKESVIEEQKKYMGESMHEDEHVKVRKKTLNTDDTATEVQYNKINAEIALIETMVGTEADAVTAEVKGIKDTDSLSVLSHDEAAADKEALDCDGRAVSQAQRNDVHLLHDTRASIHKELETLQHETVAVTKEVNELKQLEQMLLQEHSERSWVEKELRTIAEEEEIWLESTQAFASSQQKTMSEQRSTAPVGWPEDAEIFASFSKEQLLAPAIPWSALAQIGLLSIMFLGLAAVASYLLVQYRKDQLFARRRTRWKSLADVNNAEEIMLLSDDTSDDENDNDAPAYIVERSSSVDVKATVISTEDGEVDYEKEVDEALEVVDEDENHVKAESDLESVAPEIVAERTTTVYMTDSTATPSSDASSDTTTVSVFTPSVSSLETPSISQRTRQRRRQIRM